MRVVALLLVLTLSPPAAADRGDDPLLAAFAAEERVSLALEEGPATPTTVAREALHGAAAAGVEGNRRRLATALEEAFVLPPPAAEALLDALLAAQDAATRERWQAGTVTAEELVAIESGYRQAERLALRKDLIRIELALIYDRWSDRWPAAPAGLLQLLTVFAESEVDPVPVLERVTGFRAESQVMRLYLEREPVHPLALAALAAGTYHHSWRAALYRVAGEALAARPQPLPAGTAARLAGAELEALLELGLVEEALGRLGELPPAVAARLLTAPGQQIDEAMGLLRSRGSIPDLRRELAAARLLAGQIEEARRLMAATAVSGEEDELGTDDQRDYMFQRDRQRIAWQDTLLEALAEPTGDDPFPFLAGLLASDVAPAGAGIWRRATAELALREGYPEIARYQLAKTRAHLDVELDVERFPPLPPEERAPVLAAALAEIGELVAARALVLEDRIASLPAVLAGVAGPDPAAAAIRRQLDRPPIAETFHFVRERSSEPWVQQLDADLWSGLEALARELELPAGFIPVALTSEDRRPLVLALGHALQNRTQMQGYWLLRPDPGGGWGEPLFAGLVSRHPYQVRPGSVARRTATGGLVLEVARWEEPSSPGGLWWNPGPPSSYGWLTLPLDRLAADGDGDGLTDLVEERLWTDPRRPDTDGDGLGDADDPLPQVPRGAAPSPSRYGSAFQTQLANLMSLDPRRDPDVLHLDQTLVVTAPRPLLVGLEPRRRMVVLAPEEAATALAAHALLPPVEIELYAVDRSGTRSLLVWKGLDSGGVSVAELAAEHWVETEGWRRTGCVVIRHPLS